MDQIKTAVSVAEMARMIHMSRSRLYQLLGSTFPQPKKDDRGRPYFDAEQQTAIIESRRRNAGIDGRPILFRTRRSPSAPSSPKGAIKKPSVIPEHKELIEVLNGVRALGLSHINRKAVEQCLSTTYPDGKSPTDRSTVIRAVFLSLKCRDCSAT